MFCVWSSTTGYIPHTISNKKKDSIELFETGKETGWDWKLLKNQGYECHEIEIVRVMK